MPNTLPFETQGGGAIGGFMGSNIQKSGEAVKRLDRLAPRVGRFNPPPGLNPGLTWVGLNPLFGLNWVKPGLN